MPDDFELPHDVQALLDLEAKRPGPPAGTAARLGARLAASVTALPSSGAPDAGSDGGPMSGGGAASEAASALSQGAAGAAQGLVGGSLAKSIAIGAVGLLTGASLGAGVATSIQSSARFSVAASERVGSQHQSRAVRAQPSPVLSADAPPVPVPATSAKIGAGASHDQTLARERALIEVARTAVAQGRGKSALAALNQHRQSYPRGRLAEEREALMVRALRLEKQDEQAAAQAEKFKKSYPKSILGPVVDDDGKK